MSDIPVHDAEAGWEGTVAFTSGPDPIAYRPGEVIVGGERGRDEAQRILAGIANEVEPIFPDDEESVGPAPGRLFLVRAEVDALTAVAELRTEGVPAAPNHVMFAHACECCGPHPAHRWAGALTGAPVFANPVFANPVFANPVFANPVFANPVFANPVFANPVFANPAVQATGKRKSSAKPSAPPTQRPNAPSLVRTPRIAVLDTGMAADGHRPRPLDPFRPSDQVNWELPDGDGDDLLDPAAGHGTFIAGLINLVTFGCDITVERVLSNYGEGDEVKVARRVRELAGTVDLINLSFGGYAMDRMHALEAAIRRAKALGTVVVASAGNDGTCRPTYPAALADVVSVGAFGPGGPAPFTNYGPWVRSCAPGIDIISFFFGGFEGKEVPTAGGIDPDNFDGWAQWSGTSFAAPMVTAALARYMGQFDVGATDAVAALIDAPGLLRLPDLGTVVNVS